MLDIRRNEAAYYAFAIADVGNMLDDNSMAAYFLSSEKNSPHWHIVGRLTVPDHKISINRADKQGLSWRHECGVLATRVINDEHQYLLVLPDLRTVDQHLADVKAGHSLKSKDGSGNVISTYYSIYENLRFKHDETASDYANRAVTELREFFKSKELNTLVVVGHGLGAVLGIYLLMDLGKHRDLAFSLQGCFFGCPRPGNRKFADEFNENIPNHAVYQFDRDPIHELPTAAPESHDLIGNIVISTANAEVVIKDVIEANHHVVSYAAMLYFGAKSNVAAWCDYFRRRGGRPDYLESVKTRWWLIKRALFDRDKLEAAKKLVTEGKDIWSALRGEAAKLGAAAAVSFTIGATAGPALGQSIEQFVKNILSLPPGTHQKDVQITPPSLPAGVVTVPPVPQSDDANASDLKTEMNIIVAMTQTLDQKCLVDISRVTDFNRLVGNYMGSLRNTADKGRMLSTYYAAADTDVIPPVKVLSAVEFKLDETVDSIDRLNHDIGTDLKGEAQIESDNCSATNNSLNEKLQQLKTIIEGKIAK